MASDGGGGGSSKGLVGKKRKAAGGRGDTPARREPRRGIGVAALENIRAQLVTAENFYMFPPMSTPAAAPLPPPPPPPPLPSLAGHVPGVRLNPYVGNGAPQRDYYTPCYGAQHYTNGVFTRFLQVSHGHAVPRLNHQAGQNVVVATAPHLEQQDHHRRAQAKAQQQQEDGQMIRPQVAFVDLVDSDDEDDARAGAGEEELDLELKL